MNITYLFGNGFDLNIGMKTHYSDFYQYYLKTTSRDIPCLVEFKKNLEENLETWACLELALGRYLKPPLSLEEMDIIVYDLCEHLSIYLDSQEQNLALDELDKQAFINDLAYPENRLLPEDSRTLRKFKGMYSNHSHCYINVVTFNYTSLIEKILEFKGKKLSLFKAGNQEHAINEVIHIHGSILNGIILGVNDVSQFHNEELSSNIDAIESIVKPMKNKALKMLVDEQAINVIQGADLIVLFGLSLGDTDKIWWNLIAETLLKKPNSLLLIYSIGDEFSVNQKHRISRESRSCKDSFCTKTNLTPSQRTAIEDRIVIGYNTKMFKVKKKEETV